MRLMRAAEQRAFASDRRAHTRHLCAVAGECRVGPHFVSWWPATILDVSAGGATVALWGWGKPENDISIRFLKEGEKVVEINAAIRHIHRIEDVWLLGCAFERELRDPQILATHYEK
jgi:PilZ domain